jgi:P-type conjugative transfer protein TrbJ
MRKIWRNLAASLAIAVLASAASARAQIAVIDPANLAQSVIQATHALEQIHNQIQQIDQQARMLARNPLQLSPELSESIGEARDLFNAARGIAFQVDQISEDVQNLYPDTFEDFDLGEIDARTDQWLSEDRAALERAMRAEAQAAQSIETARGRIDRAMSASADAEGQTGAVQAGNQLLGINAAQLAEIHALLVAQGRALTTERLERVAREQRAQEIQRRAFPTQSSGELTPARTAF